MIRVLCVLAILCGISQEKSYAQNTLNDRIDAHLAKLYDASGSSICGAVFIDKGRVLTSRHCFTNLSPESYQVGDMAGQMHRIASIHLYAESSLFYPNFDLAILVLHIQNPRVKQALKIADFSASKSRTEFIVARIINEQIRLTELRKLELVNGIRIPHLLLAKSLGKPLCSGDSGSPVFMLSKNKIELLALVSGDWPSLTGPSAACTHKQTIFTYVQGFSDFIKNLQPPTISTHLAKSRSLTALCLDRVNLSDSWFVMQKILTDMIAQMNLDVSTAKALLSRCQDIERLFAIYMRASPMLRMEQHFNLDGLSFLSRYRRLSLSDVRIQNLSHLSQMPQLEELELIGLQTGTDLNSLNTLPELKRLSIKHASGLKGLADFIRRSTKLEHLRLFNINSPSISKPQAWQGSPREWLDLQKSARQP